MPDPTYRLAAILLAALPIATHAAATVDVEGIASCGEASIAQCRELALQEAKRRAVERVVGTRIEAETRVRDFSLEKDQVDARSVGEVRRYDVLDAGMIGETGYRIVIRAEVAGPDGEKPGSTGPLPAPFASPELSMNGRSLIRNGDFADGVETGWIRLQGDETGLRELEPADDGVRMLYSGPGADEAQLGLMQEIMQPLRETARFRARLRMTDRQGEGFPRVSLELLDRNGGILAALAWTPDPYYRPAGVKVESVTADEEHVINATLGELFARLLPVARYAEIGGARVRAEIAPPEGHRCSRCLLELSHVSLEP